jgi:uncharacterized protein YxeA
MKKVIFILVFCVIVIAFIVFFVLKEKNTEQENSLEQSNTKISEVETSEQIKENFQHEDENQLEEQTARDKVRWEYINDWKSFGTPPDCPATIISEIPVDMKLVTGALYPGQYRGNDYKAHGGFRFADSNNEIEVRAPMDAYLNRGSRYLQDGELQYLLEFINQCGIMYRFDHLSVLSPALQEIAQTFPEPLEGDSRSVVINNFKVQAGDLIATSIGIEGSVFIDFGVYDLRRKNKASEDSSWLEKHQGDQAPYGLCWFDLLPEEHANKMRRLPTGVEGKISDYCE